MEMVELAMIGYARKLRIILDLVMPILVLQRMEPYQECKCIFVVIEMGI
jgi:hypothetical protein